MEEERWLEIEDFPGYSVSNWGWIRSDKSGRVLAQSENQFGLVCIGLMQDGEQKHRSVPLLVAKAFLPDHFEAYDTPINLDGNRWNNRVENLVWRPRWFAIKYNQQFKDPYPNHIPNPIENLKTGEICSDSFECATKYGVLESDLVLSILNRTYVWPVYQEFGMVEL
jgi:hypothetical protein